VFLLLSRISIVRGVDLTECCSCLLFVADYLGKKNVNLSQPNKLVAYLLFC
jgi:hypothetical protein